jgi:hypothetical protein
MSLVEIHCDIIYVPCGKIVWVCELFLGVLDKTAVL